jgi:ubiquinol-cytochrome c reductase cytochrome c1 subunit
MRALIVALALSAVAGTAQAAEGDMAEPDTHAMTPPSQHWSFSGLFGTYDRAAAQRGLQVYREVCSACHGLRLVAFRTLADLGYSEDQVKAIAAEYEVTDGPDDEGEMFTRPGKPADRFVPPFPNDNAARAANGGALPPDLSLITKARAHGADYIHALLTGYSEAPSNIELTDGQYYNAYFSGRQLAMPPPLSPEAVEYADGTEASVDQMAHDVTTFLNWAAEPELEARKRMGIKVILFLIVLTAMLYAVKRKVWADVH